MNKLILIPIAALLAFLGLESSVHDRDIPTQFNQRKKEIVLDQGNQYEISLESAIQAIREKVASQQYSDSLESAIQAIREKVASQSIDSGVNIEEQKKFQENYTSLLEEIAQERNNFKEKYLSAISGEEKKEIINQSRNYLFNALVDQVFPQWYGTEWDFNGATKSPRQGKVACGVFVSTTLKQAGFDISRIRMARQPSEYIIKNLVYNKNRIKRFSNKPIDYFVEHIKEMGAGLYMVGLDIHVGFVVNKGNNDISFVHSSYYNPPLAVVSEKPDSFNPLNQSKYRVVGKLLGDKMMKKWLLGENFPMVYDYFKK